MPLSSGVSPVSRDQCPTPQQLDLHVMYSTFRAQQPAPSAGIYKIPKCYFPQLLNTYKFLIFLLTDSNPDDISTSDSNPPGFMRVWKGVG